MMKGQIKAHITYCTLCTCALTSVVQKHNNVVKYDCSIIKQMEQQEEGVRKVATTCDYVIL